MKEADNWGGLTLGWWSTFARRSRTCTCGACHRYGD